MTQSTEFPLLDDVKALVKKQLKPLVNDIDQKGTYPREFMQALGEIGGFAVAIPEALGGLGRSLEEQIEVGAKVGAACGSTAFAFWCQTASAWYLYLTPNDAVREQYLADVAYGKLLCGTGMSNTVKHLAGIEKMHLRAERHGDDYQINGILPWVSNIGEDHLLIVSAQVADGEYVKFAIPCDTEGLELHPCPEFSGMEGTETYNVRFHNLHLSADNVIAHPEQFYAQMANIKPGFVLTQTAMGLGVIDGSLKTIKQTNKTHSHVNVYLDGQYETLAKRVQQLRDEIYKLSKQLDQGVKASIIDILKVRAKTSELTLEATQSAALHAGAKGYLRRHAAQRRLREAIFVSIVTPALKHLRKEIHDLEAEQAKAS